MTESAAPNPFAIKEVKGFQAVDSRGLPTVKAYVTLENGTQASAAVPSGASTGEREAVELRDGETKNFDDMQVTKAVGNVNGVLAQAITGMDARDQKGIDAALCELAGERKTKLGANATLGISLAAARAAASAGGIPLHERIRELAGKESDEAVMPVPMMNILNGGAHAAQNNLDFQEFMIMPVGAKTESEAVLMGAKVYSELKKILKKDGLSTSIGDEGGFAPAIDSPEKALDYIMQAVEAAGFNRNGKKDIVLALDPAASEFYDRDTKKYVFGRKFNENVTERSTDEMVEYYRHLVNKYPIASIEDGLDQNDHKGWQKLYAALGDKIQIVGDDLVVTDPAQIRQAFDDKKINSALIKLNQIGTLSETLDAIRTAQEKGGTAVISHRSGETEDSFIADLAVGTGAGQIKTGSVARGERTAKYNRLTEIEGMELEKSVYPGMDCFAGQSREDETPQWGKRVANGSGPSQQRAR